MTQTVRSTFFNQNLPATAGFGSNSNLKLKAFVAFVSLLASLAGLAQTYTTKAAGNWNNAATWVNGQMPGTSIGTGKTVIVKHAVSFSQNNDLSIAGTLRIEGDSLRFVNGYDKKVIVAATGVLHILNGGFLMQMGTNKGEMEIQGGRFVADKGRITIGKLLKTLAGTRKTLTNSYLLVGDKYEMEGTSANRSIDTLRHSTIETVAGEGVFDLKDYCSFVVDNARFIVGKDKFVVKSTSSITTLPGAAGNYGIKTLKVETDLQNDGTWDARIDAFCVGGNVNGSNFAAIDFSRPEDCSDPNSAPAPELSFINPVLVKGTANKEGAEYRFSNITTGIDAVIKLKKFSRSDIVMKTVDNSSLGWSKAFQPEFGLPGVVAPKQDWFVDFELSFFETGTNKKKRVQKVDLTALDVDGDGNSISEYAVFSNAASVSYSTISHLSTSTAGSLGSMMLCGVCNKSSNLIQCNQCQGLGYTAGDVECSKCNASGALHSACEHAYQGLVGNTLYGPVQNYNNIDTNGTAVMATYQYVDVEKINFRYGAKSAAVASNGSGIRLNSLWSKSFNLQTAFTALPIKFENFSVQHQNGNATLTWTASHDGDMDHFIVQRSTDGKTYSNIATVLAGDMDTYSYKDKHPASNSGYVYYRVISIDRTADAVYSSVKMVRLQANELATAQLGTYPNPVAGSLRVALPQQWQGKSVQLQIVNSNGMTVKNTQVANALQTETLAVDGLAKGFYVVKAVCGTELAQQRIIKE